jgi:hypothetical protein
LAFYAAEALQEHQPRMRRRRTLLPSQPDLRRREAPPSPSVSLRWKPSTAQTSGKARPCPRSGDLADAASPACSRLARLAVSPERRHPRHPRHTLPLCGKEAGAVPPWVREHVQLRVLMCASACAGSPLLLCDCGCWLAACEQSRTCLFWRNSLATAIDNTAFHCGNEGKGNAPSLVCCVSAACLPDSCRPQGRQSPSPSSQRCSARSLVSPFRAGRFRKLLGRRPLPAPSPGRSFHQIPHIPIISSAVARERLPAHPVLHPHAQRHADKTPTHIDPSLG